MSITTITPSPKRLSKAATKKQERSQYWRSVKLSRDAIEEERNIFRQKVVVVTSKNTELAESFSAIIDSRRGIIIK